MSKFWIKEYKSKFGVIAGYRRVHLYVLRETYPQPMYKHKNRIKNIDVPWLFIRHVSGLRAVRSERSRPRWPQSLTVSGPYSYTTRIIIVGLYFLRQYTVQPHNAPNTLPLLQMSRLTKSVRRHPAATLSFYKACEIRDPSPIGHPDTRIPGSTNTPTRAVQNNFDTLLDARRPTYQFTLARCHLSIRSSQSEGRPVAWVFVGLYELLYSIPTHTCDHRSSSTIKKHT